MPKIDRNTRWNFLWERDPHVCYLCGLPWYGMWTLEEIRAFARSQKQEVPQGLSQLQELDYWKEFVPFARKKLIIEHKDENRKNNSPENLGLSHQPCNVNKRLEMGRKSRRPDKWFNFRHLKNSQVNVYERVSEEVRGNVPTLMRNLEQEPIYRKAALDLIRKYGEMKWRPLNAASSEKAGCSMVTGDRHLEKLTSVFGPLESNLNENKMRVVKKRLPPRKQNAQGNKETE